MNVKYVFLFAFTDQSMKHCFLFQVIENQIEKKSAPGLACGTACDANYVTQWAGAVNDTDLAKNRFPHIEICTGFM